MPPLTLQPTHTSVQSWWSDSNPLLVANPIHTGAKPLTKRMYHRDILNFIKRQQGIPLSPETINIYASYLEWRYVSDASKIAICMELRARAEVEAEAQAIIASGWLSNLVLHSSNTGELSHACRMLGILAQHESTIGVVLEVEPCMQLITLLRGSDIEVVTSAMYALSWIPCDRKGAEAAVTAGAQDLALELLSSANSEVRRHTCWMLGRLAGHDSTVAPVLAVKPCVLLVALLRDTDILVVEGAIYALSQIACYRDGAEAVENTAGQDVASKLLHSPNSGVRRWSSWMLGNLAEHDSTVGAALAVAPCVQLLRDNNVDVVECALYALTQISRAHNGATIVWESGVFDVVHELLQSSHATVRKWACFMLSTLAAHDSTVGSVLGSQPCERLVTLLCDNDTAVRGGAIQALSQISRNTNGSKAVVNASTLDFVQELLQSGNNEVRSWTCLMLGELVRHGVAADVLPSEICVQLVTLLRDDDINVVANAICALSHIAVYEDGARAVMDASAPKFARELLESVNSEVRSRTSLMLGNLVGYESFMADTVLAPELSVQLVALLSDGDIDVVENSIYALSQITSQPNGANAAMDATVLKCTPELLQSENSEVRRWTCYMLGNLAGDENFTVAVLASVQCPQLVVLLRDINVVESAIYALSHIASTPNGANAVMNAGALQFAEGLLDSEDSEVRRWTSLMLVNLAGHEGFSAAALTSELEIVWEMGTKAIGKRRLVYMSSLLTNIIPRKLGGFDSMTDCICIAGKPG